MIELPLTSVARSGRGLLIGAGGLLGPAVDQALAEASFDYDVLARHPEGLRSANNTSRILAGDLSQAAEVSRCVQGHTWVVYVPTNGPEKTVHAAHIARACSAHDIQLVIKISAILAGEDPPLSFGIEHRLAEQSIIDSGVPWVMLRPSFFMQTFQMFAQRMRDKGQLLVPVPTGQTAFIDTLDVAACVVACLNQPHGYLGKPWPLTGPEPLTMAAVADLFAQAAGRPVKLTSPPRWLAGLAMRFGEGMDPWLAKRLTQMFAALEAGREAPVSPNVPKMLGRNANSFEDFLSRDNRAGALWDGAGN